jgi:hypothetical protein
VPAIRRTELPVEWMNASIGIESASSRSRRILRPAPLERVERRGADIAEDNADCADGEYRQALRMGVLPVRVVHERPLGRPWCDRHELYGIFIQSGKSR